MSNDTRPEIRFPGFTEDWEERKLSDLMSFSNGINAPKENYGKGRKMISVMDILDEQPIQYASIRNSVEVDKKVELKNKVENGDLVFVRSSEISEEVGWAKAYLEEEYALYSGFSIRGKKIKEFNPHFVELSLNSVNRKQIERKAGGSTRFNVSQTIMNSLEILMPKIEEQNKIDWFFKQLDDTIALHQRKLDLLKETKKGFLQKMFPKNGAKVPEIRFPGFTEDWEEKKFKEVINSGIKGKAKAEMSGTKSLYLDTNYLNGGVVTYVDSPRDVENDDVLILWDGSQAGTVYYGFSGALGSTLKAYRAKESGAFLYQQLKRNQQIIYDRYRTPNIPHVVKTFTDEFMVSMPSFEEQQKIGSFFKQLDDTIALHQRELDLLKETKKGFLQKMFV